MGPSPPIPGGSAAPPAFDPRTPPAQDRNAADPAAPVFDPQSSPAQDRNAAAPAAPVFDPQSSPAQDRNAADPAAPVFDLQSLSTHDGPGFRTVVFLQGCPLRCTWCCNPEGQEPRPYLRWRRPVCQGCLRCVAACPNGAACVDGDARPRFERSVCRTCTTFDCVDACCEGALETTGRQRRASEVLRILRRDARLYRNSGGGVTFSGGEPLLHAAFVLAVAEPLRAMGIPVALETCGAYAADSACVQAVLEASSCTFFDLKTLDPARHLQFTGFPLAGVMANLERLAAMPAMRERIVLSLPIIPGVSDVAEHATAVADLASRLGIRRARVLPYHRLALGKYESLGLDYPHAPWDADLRQDLLDGMRATLASRGLHLDA